jgi:putative membrane protein
MKSLAILVSSAFLFFGIVSCNNEATTDATTKDSSTVSEKKTDTMSNTMNDRDQAFLSDQVGGNYAEIKFTQLAQQKSKNAEVKDVAKFLETEHTNALNDLKDLAGKKNVNVPSEEPQDAKDKYKMLSEKSAKDFDKKWVEELISKHEKSIAKLEGADISDPDLKTWVTNILPKLRIHHDKLMQLHNKMK